MLYALEMSKRILELRDTHKWTHEEWKAALDLQNDSIPITLHEGAFATVIEAQGTDAQRDFWIPKCRSYQVIGCYAQTELAHGSNVQGLETIAKFDPATDEYIMSSPRRESTKWWIGGMGVLANHALVQAILELPSGRKGPHLFIVPIRNQTTHRPLPNVTVGDIGPKAYGGFCYMDNGYLHLSSVRIPRANMLQRFASVSADGSYTPAKHDKLSYGSMVALRAGIPINSGWNLARAVTIAIRYCINRRQFSPSKTEAESQVLTYASTKMRLYPLLARSYAYIFAGRSLWALYQQFLESLTKDGDISMLPEIHALSTALKVKATWDCVSGLEEARKCMGGHGFSHMSGVGSLFAAQTPSQTYEGDNYVISQQIARALVKALGFLKQMPDAPLPDSFAYLRLAVNGLRIAKDDDLHMLHARAAGLVAELAKEVATNPEKGWTDHSWTAARAAAAHADVFVCSSLPETPLTKLHILSTLVAALPELLETGVVTSAQAAKELRRRQEAEVEGLSIGDVVGLTDAFEFDDWELPGVVGGKEGMVYGKMLKTVEEWDVNKGDMGEEIRSMALEITGKGWRSKL
jgi:acyl-CoA oxidase